MDKVEKNPSVMKEERLYEHQKLIICASPNISQSALPSLELSGTNADKKKRKELVAELKSCG